jgi:putative ABC transport system permease protein
VQSVAYGGAAPADYVPRAPYELADAPAVDAQSRPLVTRFPTGTTYFRTLGVSLLAGREFADTDRAETAPVAIVNERLASKSWPGQDPIGKRLRIFDGDDGAWLTVVGVVSNVVQNDRTRQELEPLVYVPYLQRPQRSMFVFARTAVAPESLIPSFRRAVYALDPDLPVPALWPLDERFARSYAFERQLTWLYLVFGAVALLLASVGVYATMTRSVSNRTQEIGVRTALGATPWDVGRFVFRSAACPLGLGLAIGVVGSLAATYVFRSLLVQVSPGDPAALSLAAIALLIAALLGCVIPARRALRVDPIIALRHE